jgi:uncharacterized protein (DUF1501 family)
MSDLTRRVFLKSGGLSLVSLGMASGGPAFLARAALAATPPSNERRRRTLVAVFQRGAMDALAAAPPVDDPTLRRLRPRIGLAATRSGAQESLLDLGNGFALHPALAPLRSYFLEQRLAIVHAVGSPDPSRSHFDAQDYMETATPGRKGTPSGWLNRVCGELGHEASPFRAVAMTPALPRSLYGEEPAVAVARLEDFRVQMPASAAAAASTGRGFEALYEQASQDLLREAGAETFEALRALERIDVEKYRPAAGADYPRGPLGDALRQIALLVKSRVGVEVAFAESGGWDTHVQQGSSTGTFAQRARDLAQAIAAFWIDLDGFHDEVVLMTMTEFGRTVAENGSGGTDHGHGSCLFVLGNRVLGGKVHGDFPGLDRDALYEGRDLPVTTDFRSVFSEVAAAHLGVTDTKSLFPGWNGPRLPLLRG